MDAYKGVRRVNEGVNNDDDAGIVYFIALRTRPVMVNDLDRVSRTVLYSTSVRYRSCPVPVITV